MIPPTYLAAQLQAAQRRAREGVQAVPSMESDSSVNQQQDSLFSECVLDLSRYLSSSDIPTTSREFFDDLFHERVANDNALRKPLPGVIKIKEEPDSTTTSRCSTPESLLPEHDFDNTDFPTPNFQGNDNNNNRKENKGESLMCQLQSIHSSNQSTDNEDSDEEINVENLDHSAQKLKAALAQYEAQEELSDNMSPSHRNTLKSPRLKSRKNLEKGSDEYLVKRQRNNVAVRKSRTKAKLKHIETQMRVGELTEENEQLRNRVSTLTKELNALKSFITYNCPSSTKSLSFSSYPPILSSTKIM